MGDIKKTIREINETLGTVREQVELIKCLVLAIIGYVSATPVLLNCLVQLAIANISL